MSGNPYKELTGKEKRELRRLDKFENYPEFASKFQSIKADREIRPFNLNYPQRHTHKVVSEQLKKRGYVFVIILKCRQWGGTTYTSGLGTKMCQTEQNFNALSVSQERNTRLNVYQMVKTFYENTPDLLRMPIELDRTGELIKFNQRYMAKSLGPNNTFSFMLSGNDVNQNKGKGHGVTYNFIHFSEVAHYGEGAKELVNGILAGAKSRDGTIVIFESTANGFEYFHSQWEMASDDPEAEFVRIFIPWFWEDSYMIPFQNDDEMRSFERSLDKYSWCTGEKSLLENFGEGKTGEHPFVTLEKLKWRRWYIKVKTSYDLMSFRQNFPATPDEAFIGSGQCIFDTEQIRDYRRTLLVEGDDGELKHPGERGRLEWTRESRAYIETLRVNPYIEIDYEKLEVKWVSDEVLGDWLVWEHPDNSKEYHSGWDNAEGVHGGDYQAGTVINDKRQLVCVYRSQIPFSEYWEVLIKTAIYYNRHTLAPERNFLGAAIISDIKRIYPKIVKAIKNEDKELAEVTDRYGWMTTAQSRPLLIRSMQDFLRTSIEKIKSVDLLDECLRFVKKKNGKIEHEEGYHDDILFSFMIAIQTADFTHYSPELNIKPIYKNFTFKNMVTDLPDIGKMDMFRGWTFMYGGVGLVCGYYTDSGRFVIFEEHNIFDTDQISAFHYLYTKTGKDFGDMEIHDVGDPHIDPMVRMEGYINPTVQSRIEREFMVSFDNSERDQGLRTSMVDNMMSSTIGGKPELVIHEGCRDLISGFRGKYVTKMQSVDIPGTTKKDRYSNIHNALQNLVCYLNEQKSTIYTSLGRTKY